MNKKIISAAVLVGLAGTASAVNVNPKGLGEVLLYPYYTLQGGKHTYVQVVNTTNQTKAVKVRFSEGVNTWEVLDFNLYLSPWDVWAGGLALNEDGKPVLYSSDTSCTVPKVASFADGGEPLRSANITNYAGSTSEVTTLKASERLMEGHIEVIEMGVVKNGTGDNDPKLEQAIKHVNGVPRDCDLITNMWDGGTWESDATMYMRSPTGGLFGSASIIDVAKGTDRGYDAVAVENFFDVTKSGGIAHSFPGNSFPNLNADALHARDAIDDLTNVGSTNFAGLTFANTVDALSAALATGELINQYYTFDGTNAATDWVVSFPTKHFYVNSNTATATSGQVGYANAPGTVPMTDPVTGATVRNSGWIYKAPFNQGFGVPVKITTTGREEERKGSKLDFSPAIGAAGASLPYEVNVLEFHAERNVLGSLLKNEVKPVKDSGWASINFKGGQIKTTTPAGPNQVFAVNGIPAIGFATLNAQNGTLEGGVLANYSSLYQHKAKRATLTTVSS